MKITRYSLPILMLTSLALASCKTTEANYKAAYEIAKGAAENSADQDDGLNDEIRRLLNANKKSSQSIEIVGSDTITVQTMLVGMDSGPHSRVPRYSVVLNAFTQKFNAEAMKKRLAEAGFEGAYVFHTSVPDYYVAAEGCDKIEGVPAILRRVEKAGNLGQRAGFPAVIRNGGWRPGEIE